MIQVLRHVAVIVTVGIAVAVCTSCSTEDAQPDGLVARPVQKGLAPSLANVTLGSDYVDGAGRLWNCMGPAQFVEGKPEKVQEVQGPLQEKEINYEDMTEDELAEKLRPVALVGGYVYRLAEPDHIVARKVREMKVVPSTEGRRPVVEQPPDPATVSTTLKPQHIFSPDGRVNTTAWNTYPTSANGHIERGCSTALIGVHTGATAAHCIFTTAGWLANTNIAYAAVNWDDGDPNNYLEPWGRWPPTWIIPGAWISNPGDGANYPGDVTWDFAIVDWGSASPGVNVGWFGTTWWFGNPVYMHGYSGDKPPRTQMFRNGDMAAVIGAEYRHFADMRIGDSGAVLYDANYRVTCINTREVSEFNIFSGTFNYNMCRRWDSATHNFFDVNASNWP